MVKNYMANFFITLAIVLVFTLMISTMVDMLYFSWKYRKKALETDFTNQFQVQRLLNELLYDEKVDKSIKKKFLQSIGEDCRDQGFNDLADKAERAAAEITFS